MEKSQQLRHQKNDRELLTYFCQTTYIACLAIFSSCAKEETFDKNNQPFQNEVQTDKSTSTATEYQSSSEYSNNDDDHRGCGG